MTLTIIFDVLFTKKLFLGLGYGSLLPDIQAWLKPLYDLYSAELPDTETKNRTTKELNLTYVSILQPQIYNFMSLDLVVNLLTL